MSDTNTNEDIFYNDWVACLSAHYLYTLTQGDTANALGLRRVLLEAGASEAYIDDLAASWTPPVNNPVIAMPEGMEAIALLASVVETEVIAAVSAPQPEPILAEPLPPDPIPAERAHVAPQAAPMRFETIGFELPAVDASGAPAAESDLIPEYPSIPRAKKPAKKPAPPQPTLF